MVITSTGNYTSNGERNILFGLSTVLKKTQLKEKDGGNSLFKKFFSTSLRR